MPKSNYAVSYSAAPSPIPGHDSVDPATCGFTFGTEIESIWASGGQCPDTNNYHSSSNSGCVRPYPSNWRVETDGSLSGGAGVEVISPILQGANGVVEVGTVLDMMRRGVYDASDEYATGNCTVNSSCGGHIHLGRPDGVDSYFKGRVQLAFSFYEEIAFAMTGAYSRYSHNSYTRKFKGNVFSEGNFSDSHIPNNGDKYRAVNVGPSHTVEFRYPSGTLSLEQFVINLSLSTLVMHMAMAQAGETPSDANRRIVALGKLGLSNIGQGLFTAVYEGAKNLRDNGWYKGGAWIGVPYNMASPIVGSLSSFEAYSGVAAPAIAIPDEDALLRRLLRQVKSFARRAHFTQPQVDMLLEVFDGRTSIPRSEIEEVDYAAHD